MLKIGVLSDTHLTDFGRGLAFLRDVVDTFLNDAEMLLHAGDIVIPDLLLAFPEREIVGVRGNMDPPEKNLPLRRIISVGGFRIGLAHGWGNPKTVEDRLVREFAGDRIDCLVYGHTHFPVCHRRDEILVMNPGSPTDRRHAPRHSVGMLEIGEEIEGRIIDID